ncbi:MAG: EVE domain-containing protein [Thermoproteota archaeon]|jgi:predicted RNA-binding protein|nr:MAG: EVE domain-containing protein [Candidatus Korarchaeota archaeon]
MTCWLCITTEENWNIIKERNIWGVPERHKNTISKVKPGDYLLIYVKQKITEKEVREPRIVALYEAESEVFRDSSRIFKAPPGMGNETFPLRIKLRPVKIFEKPVEFKKLIPDLKFVRNKKKWTGHLMGKAMREIPEEDFRLIMSINSL